MFRRLALLGFVLLMAVSARPASGDARMQAIMRTKLSNTQALLKAIVTTDFKEIDRAASALGRINEMEIVSWQNPPRREYVQQAMLFMSSVDDLRAASQRHDIEGVGGAYTTLVTTCVHCHAYVRDARSASLRLPSPSTN
jgi:cytochrome c556